MRNTIPTAKYNYMLVFEFTTENDLSDTTIREFGDEVTENVCAFFRSKRSAEPIIGSISLRKMTRKHQYSSGKDYR
jgi:hypothetical protein